MGSEVAVGEGKELLLVTWLETSTSERRPVETHVLFSITAFALPSLKFVFYATNKKLSGQ